MKIIFFTITSLCFFGAVNAQQTQNESANVPGKRIYEQNCLPCHQADGSGVPGLAPPLINGTFVNGDKERLIDIILKGMQGVEIKGEHYANPMPAFSYLSDDEISEVLTYVRGSFTNKGSAVNAADVARARTKDN